MSLGSYRSYPEINKAYLKFKQCIESGEEECRAPNVFNICLEVHSMFSNQTCTTISVPMNFYTKPLEYGRIKSEPHTISFNFDETIYKKK